MSQKRFTDAVGRKFHSDGSVRQFPGNTIICFLDPERHATVYQRCLTVQSTLLALPFAHKFAPLPPSSFHMTVVDLLVDERRSEAKWSSHLPLTATLAETDHYLLENVPTVAPPKSIQMRYSGKLGNVSIILKPDNAVTKQALYGYRRTIAEKTGVQSARDESYQFHISLAYQLIELTEDEEVNWAAFNEGMGAMLADSAEIYTPAAPELVFFDDMFRFVPADQYHTLASRS